VARGTRIERLRVAVKGRRDASELRRRHPTLLPSDDDLRTLTQTLSPVYDGYVRDVSDVEWSMSLETAACLYHLCRAMRPARLLDTGSGFSSYVFRLYAREAPGPVTVVSADDDEQWLARTAEFLRQNDLPTDGLVRWPPEQVATGQFDLVFHDLAFGSARVAAIPLMLAAVREQGGAVLFDDAHHNEGRSSPRDSRRG
jgi:predicted O-methyltransferase YrrM